MNSRSETLTSEKLLCAHCGDRCGDGSVTGGEQPFCCEGCRMVYSLLREHDLGTYYTLEEQPGNSLSSRQVPQRFDFLQDETVVDEIADFRGENTTSICLQIPDIHCTSCVWLLEKLYRLDEGIEQSSVNFLKRELTLTYHHGKTSLRKIAELLSAIGYEPDFRLDRVEGRTEQAPDRKLWLKMGVAGFAFGNIMLFSFPDYLAGSSVELEGQFSFFFGFLNIALALPVLLFSSREYLRSAWAALKQGGINLDVPISVGILALFGRSLYEILTGIGTGYMDSFTGLVFFLLIGRMLQKKTYERLAFDRDYRSYLPLSATVCDEEGTERSLAIHKITPGMTLRIRNQELIPADSRLLEGPCYVDYSFITGESEPVTVGEGETIYAGGRIVGRSAQMEVLKEVSGSYLTRLWNNSSFEQGPSRKRITALADRISPHFTLSVMTIALVAGMIWLPDGIEQSINVFTAVLIIACPCALALSTPFTLGSAVNILAQNGFYLKGIEVVENLSKVTDLVFDKTGTITRSDRARIRFTGGDLGEEEYGWVSAVCRQSVHPLSRKIAGHIDAEASAGSAEIGEFEEQVNRGMLATVEGHRLVIGSRELIEMETAGPAALPNGDDSGEVTRVHLAIDGQWRGCFELRPSYRPGVAELLKGLRQHFSTWLISGDSSRQKKELEPYFGEGTLLFGRKPQEKLDFITSLQEQGRLPLMIGDGLNDAGALQQSNFGIALTDNISSFTPACDAILDGDRIGSIDRYIDFSARSMRIILWSFGLSLVYNVVGLGFAVTGQLSPLVAAVLMPLSSISIMVFTSLTTLLTAKSMGLNTWK